MVSPMPVVFQPLRPDLDLTILIPARAGSKRIPHKNTRLLGGKPLVQWTLEAVKAAHVATVIVSTDDDQVAVLAQTYNAVLHARKAAHATDTASDFLWVHDLVSMIHTQYFAICRPTSPFRTASTIRRGYATLLGSGAHSIRAVDVVTHPHPAKMWERHGDFIRPVMEGSEDGTPWHSMPTQALPEVYRQNASLEIAQTWVIHGTRTISGTAIAPFFTEPWEGHDLNVEADWTAAEVYAADLARLNQSLAAG